MKKYIFPMNFDYSNKFLGLFEYKILLIFFVTGFLLAYFLSQLNISLLTSIYLFILVFIPSFLLANTTIFKEPLILFMFCIIKHYLKANIYIKKK